MNDNQIIEMFFYRDESALTHTKNKYESYCKKIAHNLLGNDLDSEECVNDAYIKLWSCIPPDRPENLGTFLGKIVRNTAIDRLKQMSAQKRKTTQSAVALEELSECIPDRKSEDFTDSIALRQALNDFLRSLTDEKRNIFVQRYWYVYSIEEISKKNKISQSKVKSTLYRTREKLKEFLDKEEIFYEKR